VARSDVVVIARPGGNAVVEVVQTYELVKINKLTTEVEPGGHGEASRGHELNLHQLASVDIQRLSPNTYPNRVGHRELESCG
jgi:hypothetical protein